MRNLIFILLIFTSGTILYSQVYIPFPIGYAKWSTEEWKSGQGPNGFDTEDGFYYEQDGDTIVNSELWHKIYLRNTYSVRIMGHSGPRWEYNYNSPRELYGLIKEVDKRIWLLKVDSSHQHCILELYDLLPNPLLLYDFNLKVGDTVNFGSQASSVVRSIEDHIFNDGLNHRIWHFDFSSGIGNDFALSWIEGIGGSWGLLTSYSLQPFEAGCRLNCFKKESLYLINSSRVPFCDSIITANDESHLAAYLNISPNPCYNELQIHSNIGEDVEYTCLNLFGQIIQQGKIKMSNSNYLLRILTEEWPAGQYNLILKSVGQQIHLPFVKLR